jgi:hypothetical protein
MLAGTQSIETLSHTYRQQIHRPMHRATQKRPSWLHKTTTTTSRLFGFKGWWWVRAKEQDNNNKQETSGQAALDKSPNAYDENNRFMFLLACARLASNWQLFALYAPLDLFCSVAYLFVVYLIWLPQECALYPCSASSAAWPCTCCCLIA